MQRVVVKVTVTKNQIAIFLKNSYLFVAIYSHGLGANPYTPHTHTHIKAHCIHTSAVHVRHDHW